ncbi:Hpt domain-containing protein [Inquilinus sp. OTU3971]|uniref:Hpt domain-containing protein n=1 Tax=Inquilinus sp. OTU3971 TaxID=3043855 RepID=UPI00313DB8AA
MDDYVGKPVQLARLQEVLQRWMPAAGSETPAPAETAAVVDPKALVGLFGDDTRTIATMLADFVAAARASAAAILSAIADGRTADVAAEAHRLKGSARIVGAGAWRQGTGRGSGRPGRPRLIITQS